jgi:hypothetical protein
LIPKIAPDKWKHFFVGIAMGLVLPPAGYFIFPGHIYLIDIISFCIIVAISYGFELYSKFTGHGHYDVIDAVAAVMGGGVGMAILKAGLMGMA